MPKWLPSYDYPPEALLSQGYWAPVTSTINWCEEDYYATQYSAEIVNTLTNLLFIYLAALGIQSCRKHDHDTIFMVAFIGYLLVGTGSFLFHATLKYPMQLVDELNMIYTTCLMCYATFSYSKSRQYSILLAIGLLSLSISITLYYHYLQDPVFHQRAYAVLTAIMLFRSMYLMEFTLRPSLKMSEHQYKLQRKRSMTDDEKATSRFNDDRDAHILNRMWNLIAYGLSIFLGGFLIWHLDNKYCSTVRSWRRQIGLPWGIILEGHGWWHLMTGTGAYFYLIWGIWLRHCLNGKQDQYELDWPRFFSLPQVIRTRLKPDAQTGSTLKKEE